MPWPVPVFVRLPGSLSLRWRLFDVKVRLTARPSSLVSPGDHRGKAPTMAGVGGRLGEKYWGLCVGATNAARQGERSGGA